MKSYTIKSKVYLKYEGNLKEIANLISKKMQIAEFWFKNDHDYPYDTVAYCEPVGFDISLSEIKEHNKYNYCLTLETTYINMDTECVDISEWLAKCIYIICNIETYAESKI
ncbi:MAG: hypothetical protein ACK6DA_00790 [Candidatus Kapaibacterium sp.]